MANAVNTNKAAVYDAKLYEAAGINPAKVIPHSRQCCSKAKQADLLPKIRQSLRVLDEEDFIHRGTWYNLPDGLTGELVERMLYYKGELMLFNLADKFYMLPYTLAGNIDCYSQFLEVSPIPFGAAARVDAKGNPLPWVKGLTRKVLYEVVDEPTLDIYEHYCVLLKDYTPQLSETIAPRYQLQEPIISLMSECPCLERTSLITHSGVKGVRVQNEDTSNQVDDAAQAVYGCAISGSAWVPITAPMEFQEIAATGAIDAQSYSMAMQSLDNLRLSLMGCKSGGLFEKGSHMLQSEQDMNEQRCEGVLKDAIARRQNFCDIVNSAFGLNIWYEADDETEQLLTAQQQIEQQQAAANNQGGQPNNDRQLQN